MQGIISFTVLSLMSNVLTLPVEVMPVRCPKYYNIIKSHVLTRPPREGRADPILFPLVGVALELSGVEYHLFKIAHAALAWLCNGFCAYASRLLPLFG